MSTPWVAALDRLEADIDHVEAALAAGDTDAMDPIAAWSAPDDLGPIPDELRPRATSISWRMTAVEQRMHDRRGALETELADLERRRGASAAYAAGG